jgi:hypothetical protein
MTRKCKLENTGTQCTLKTQQELLLRMWDVNSLVTEVWGVSELAIGHQTVTLQNRWIGRNGLVQWPPCPPNLNLLDFYLWITLKAKICCIWEGDEGGGAVGSPAGIYFAVPERM